MKRVTYLVAGAGISGLSFANFIDSKDYLVIEKENEIGGYCRTIFKGDYTWDYAGHFYHFKTDEMKKFFIEKMKGEEIINQIKNTKIYYKNKLINYPFQTNIHQLEKEEFIDCLYDLYNKTEKENYENFLDMLYGKFGKSIVEKFLKPYNEKLYACDLNNLDKNAMGRFFPYADIKQIINNMKKNENVSYNNTFLYPRKGAISFLNKLYENLNPKQIILNTEIRHIDIENKIAILSNGEEINYRYLINSIPLNKFFELVDDENTKKLEQEVSYNKVLVFNLGFENKSQNKEHWIYFPEKDINFYRVGFYNNILDEEKLSMYVEIGFSKEDSIDVENELTKTLDNLKKIGIIKDNNLKEYSTIIMDPAYVHINEKTNIKVQEYIKKLEKEDIYTTGRYGAWTYCSMEDAMIAAKSIAQRIRNN